MKINKGTIRNLNKKLIASLLAVSLISGVTGCNEAPYGIPTETNDKGKIVYASVEYDEIKNWKIVVFEFDGGKSLYLTEKISMVSRYNKCIYYYNVFGGHLLYTEGNKNTELKIIEEMYLTDYLIIYNKVQSTYTEQELKDILEQIKADYELQSKKEKQLVKE